MKHDRKEGSSPKGLALTGSARKKNETCAPQRNNEKGSAWKCQLQVLGSTQGAALAECTNLCYALVQCIVAMFEALHLVHWCSSSVHWCSWFVQQLRALSTK
eukprot:scaffold282771_cov17-Tisochrysis_lutea.AAC.1